LVWWMLCVRNGQSEAKLIFLKKTKFRTQLMSDSCLIYAGSGSC
jgi:hypothetical protein